MGHLLLLPVLGGTEDAAPHPVGELVLHAGFHVVLHAHGVEQADVLEGPGDAGLVHLHGVHAMGVLSVQEDGTVGGLVDLGEQVKHGGFSRAVGADEAGDLRAADGEVKVVHGFQATELNAQVDALQDGAFVNVPFRDHALGRDGNQFRSHVRRPPFSSCPRT